MLSLFLTNVLLGLSIALPVGTVTIEMTKQGLKNGFWHGWLVGVGGMTVDFLLMVALFLGLAPILAAPTIQTGMWLLGAIFLLYIAYDSIKNADKQITINGEKTTKKLLSSYKNGLLVAVSPSNLVFWISVFGTFLSSSFSEGSELSFIVAGLGILAGIQVHDIGLMSIVAGTRKVVNETFVKWVSIGAGIILSYFSILFFVQFFKRIF
ncbi:Threonine/homoserine/homoserine lactone efflux protein [Terribacillus halophilus]|uniref:Threonine/homoserine/homoserine lactone efflux protein n=1 Tax=Terribacillus halophilus TaxID=361279 RepID=A0A1G6LGW0_9BACI|nr:LysE family translocator [Terribacillus halophilus]SDC42471.1 Threonine/homoserine/homoserine lactone efflux protein [Terribacillus halophilus]